MGGPAHYGCQLRLTPTSSTDSGGQLRTELTSLFRLLLSPSVLAPAQQTTARSGAEAASLIQDVPINPPHSLRDSSLLSRRRRFLVLPVTGISVVGLVQFIIEVNTQVFKLVQDISV